MSVDYDRQQSYWKASLRYLVILSFLWFFVSLALPILFVNELNHIKIGGVPLGFWFSTQGSMMVMVILLFIYVALMNRLDKNYDFDEE